MKEKFNKQFNNIILSFNDEKNNIINKILKKINNNKKAIEIKLKNRTYSYSLESLSNIYDVLLSLKNYEKYEKEYKKEIKKVFNNLLEKIIKININFLNNLKNENKIEEYIKGNIKQIEEYYEKVEEDEFGGIENNELYHSLNNIDKEKGLYYVEKAINFLKKKERIARPKGNDIIKEAEFLQEYIPINNLELFSFLDIDNIFFLNNINNDYFGFYDYYIFLYGTEKEKNDLLNKIIDVFLKNEEIILGNINLNTFSDINKDYQDNIKNIKKYQKDENMIPYVNSLKEENNVYKEIIEKHKKGSNLFIDDNLYVVTSINDDTIVKIVNTFLKNNFKIDIVVEEKILDNNNDNGSYIFYNIANLFLLGNKIKKIR